MSGGFSHRLSLDSIRDGERIDLVADDAERNDIAERLGIETLDRLDAHVTLERDGERLVARGRVRAALEQACVATGEPVAELIDEPFELVFLPERGTGRADEEIELSEDECDVIFHDGSAIDLGSALADTLALAMEPYPRSAGAEAALKEAGVMNETEASPFAALAKLRKTGGEP